MKITIEEADKFLMTVDREIEQDNRYILQGRRPLRKYPLVWLSAGQLEMVINDYLESGLGNHGLTQAFSLAQGRLESYQMDGRDLARVAVMEWLLGWLKQSLLAAKNEELKVKQKIEG